MCHCHSPVDREGQALSTVEIHVTSLNPGSNASYIEYIILASKGQGCPKRVIEQYCTTLLKKKKKKKKKRCMHIKYVLC